MVNKYEAIVIGAGPGAMSAVLYLSRLSVNTLWITGYGFGGQVANTERVDNVLGFGDIPAYTLIQNFHHHVEHLDSVTQEIGLVTSLKKQKETEDFLIKTDMDGEFIAKKVILATGGEPKKLPLDNIDELTGRGISFCAICDAPFYKDADAIAVVGGGQTALEDALLLAKYGKQVYIIHRRDTFRGTQSAYLKALREDNIHFIMDTEVTKITPKEDGILQVGMIHKSGIKDLRNFNGVFLAIGQTPSSAFLASRYKDKDGFIEVDKATMESTVEPGLYAVGDIVANNIRQISVAIGDGAKAAVNLSSSLI